VDGVAVFEECSGKGAVFERNGRRVRVCTKYVAKIELGTAECPRMIDEENAWHQGRRLR
jgi:hypothetical protein